MPLRRLLCAVLVVLLAGCSGTPEPEPLLTFGWREVQLPAPAGAPGRVMLRDAIACGGVWYVTGAVYASDDTRPAAWRSADGLHWTSITFAPRSYYGGRSIVYAAGCRDGKLAAVGAKSGGAHGNPRISTWFQLPDGSMDEVTAYFELYGGNTAVNTSRIASGPAGWALTGNRASGAAVWTSADAMEFKILEGAPELSSDNRGLVWASDIAAYGPGWMIAGGVMPQGQVFRDPLIWASPDGRSWSRVPVPATDEHEDLHRLAQDGRGMFAAGLRGQTFGLWADLGTGWRPVGRFGSLGTHGIPGVNSLCALGDRLLALVSDGAGAHRLWSSETGESWREVALPGAAPAGNEQVAVITGSRQQILLTVDDGALARVWVATPS